jgi:O-antigen/teichoic acid export membrane protein
MGIVVRQGFWSTVIAYTGVLVGYANTLYLRPEFLSIGQIGLFSLVTANAMLLSPICTLGMTGAYIKHYPEFNSSDALRNQFFSFQLVAILLMNALVVALGVALGGWIADYYVNAPEYMQFLGITAVVMLTNSVFDHLFSFSRGFLDIILPSFIRDVLVRLGSILLIVGFAGGWWSFEVAVMGLGVNYAVALVVFWGYCMVKYRLRVVLKWPDVDWVWKKRIFKFALYSAVLAASYSVMTNVGYTQVTAMLGAEANGIFTTCFFIGLIVEMPRRNMTKILSPIFSKAFQEGNREVIARMYVKGSITMAVFGSLLVIGILTNLPDLFAFIPKGKEFETGFYVVVAVCLAKLMMMAFGFGSELLTFSEHYLANLYSQVVAAVVLIGVNFVLIPRMGITGAGVGYLAGMSLHTVVKFALIWKHYRLSPFAMGHLWLGLISVGVFALFWWLPLSFHPVVNIGVRSVLTTLLFVGLIYKFEVSADINQLISSTFGRILNRKN